MSKLIKIIAISVLILILVALIFRHSLCRFLLTYAAAKATGLKLSITEINCNIANSSLFLGKVTLFNPPGFENKILGKAEQIFIKYNLLAFLAGRIHLHKVKLEISEINIIRNELGKTNVAAFKKLRKKKNEAKSTTKNLPAAVSAKETPRSKPKQPKFLVDNLELSIDELTFTNQQAEIGETAVTVFKGQGPLIYTNVSNLSEVTAAVSTKVGLRHLLVNNLLEAIPTDKIKSTAENLRQRLEKYLPKSE